jgi:hypothetical protein
MIGISSDTITRLLQNCRNFRGVYPCNQIPSNLSPIKYFSIIANLSESTEEGSHFICIICFKKYVFYIDSIGLPNFNSYIDTFLKSLKRPVFYNRKKYQSLHSAYCGFYCMLYVMHFETSYDYQQLNKIVFDDDLQNNDKLCMLYVNRLLKYHSVNK